MFLYNFLIGVYQFFVFVFSFMNSKAKQFYIGRKNWKVNYQKKLSNINQPVWIHCASLGEFEQGRPLIEWIKNKFPNKKIVVTFFSPSGYEIQKNYVVADAVLYLPLDTMANAKQFIEIVNPSVVIFVKYEFWLNYLLQLKKLKIPTLIISAKFRANQIFFQSYGKLFRDALLSFKMIFVQDKFSEKLIQDLKIDSVKVANDTRFDRVYHNSLQVQIPDSITNFCGRHKILVIGSSWPEDENILIKWQKNNLPKDWKIIWVPHQINASKVNQLKNKIGSPTLLFSSLTSNKIDEQNHQHLIIDSIGMLSKIYSVASIAYIGGGFGSGIHNILEPAIFGMPIFFGPKYFKFNEAFDLINEGCAFSIQNEQQLSAIINRLISNESELERLSKIAKNYVTQHTGGTQIIAEYLVENKLI
jgi:3-deoxy-D-manno-octulosonic-acid transferase